MAQIVIDIPDQYVQRVLDAFAAKYGWVDQTTSGTKGAFAKRKVAEYVKEVTFSYEEAKREAEVRAAIPPIQPIEVT